jgi:hypothetical protein
VIGNHVHLAFLAAFLFACLLFWWLPSLLFRVVLDTEDPVNGWTLWVSFSGAALFTSAYLFRTPRPPQSDRSNRLCDLCGPLAYRATIALGIPALLIALQFSRYRAGVDYGTGEGLPLLSQAVLYTHLFVGLMYLGASESLQNNQRRIIFAATLTIVPRLIISLHWGRFFLAQAVVPILFMAIARGWFNWSLKRGFQLGATALLIIFVPSLTRGDQFIGQSEIVQFFSAGSTLKLFQDNRDLDISDRCPPLVVSLTAKTVPYNFFRVCTINVSNENGLPATLDRILTYNDPSNDGQLTGTGSNFLLELYLSGGIAAIVMGSAIFGFTCRHFVSWISRPSVFAGIWAECLSRALFAPRSTLGYVYERVPSLVFATLLCVLITWSISALSKTQRKQASEDSSACCKVQ